MQWLEIFLMLHAQNAYTVRTVIVVYLETTSLETKFSQDRWIIAVLPYQLSRHITWTMLKSLEQETSFTMNLW
jgi:hypothetical protein